MCTQSNHDALVADRIALENGSALLGWQEDGEHLLELRNCLKCGSTISDGTTVKLNKSCDECRALVSDEDWDEGWPVPCVKPGDNVRYLCKECFRDDG